MKTTKLFTMATLVLLSMSNCAKGPNEVGPSQEGKPARFGLSFTLPTDAATRATQMANSTESKVASITVFVFDAGGRAMEIGGYTHFGGEDLTAAFSNGPNMNDPNYVLREAYYIESIAGTARIYVAINLPNPQAYATEAALKSVWDEVADLSVANNFTMLSEAEVTTLVPYITGDSASVNHVDVNVGRVVSKLVATARLNPMLGSGPFATGIGLRYNILSYNVYNEALDSYLVKQATTRSTLNDFDSSYAKGSKTLTQYNTDEQQQPYLSGLDCFYIGENNSKLATGAGGLSRVGKTTYAMVTTKVTVNKNAVWNDATGVVEWTGTGNTTSPDIDLYIIKTTIEGVDYTYICTSESASDAIKTGLGGKGIAATSFKYPESYVHFLVWLNKDGLNDYNIGRNEFIHLQIMGIRNIDGFGNGIFPGYPGEEDDPEKPTDPTGDTNNPDKKDPEDPVDGAPAMIQVHVTVLPWTYKLNQAILE